MEKRRLRVTSGMKIPEYQIDEPLKRCEMRKPIAMGKISSGGTILKATPGISVSTRLSMPTEIYGPHAENIGYRVTLPARLVRDNNYIIQLTASNYMDDGDHVFTTIGVKNQTVNGFEVLIWADRLQSLDPGYSIVPVRAAWHFVIYDL